MGLFAIDVMSAKIMQYFKERLDKHFEESSVVTKQKKTHQVDDIPLAKNCKS